MREKKRPRGRKGDKAERKPEIKKRRWGISKDCTKRFMTKRRTKKQGSETKVKERGLFKRKEDMTRNVGFAQVG